MPSYPENPTPHHPYARKIYEMIRRNFKAGERLDLQNGAGLIVGIPKEKPKEVHFWNPDGSRYAHIPCPCTGVKVIILTDRSIVGDAKLAEYHRLGQLVFNAIG